MTRAVVIVGGGQGGFQTAASLRQGGFDGSIAIIGDEPGLPYQRPPLSKEYMLGKKTREALEFRPGKFFVDNRIELVHDEAVQIDRATRRVTTRARQSFGYDHLVLATGARNRSLQVRGADLDGVHGLRSMADADRIGMHLRDARSVVVVGAGFIGLEFASVANALGTRVRMVEIAERPLERAISRETAAHLSAMHTVAGIEFLFGMALASIEGASGKVAGVRLSNGLRLDADLVVVGIGVVPNAELAAQAGLCAGGGVRVDAHLQTVDPHISAIGDCAVFPSVHARDNVRLESVQNAVDQARTTAARILDKAEPYEALPWFWSDQADLKLQMAGLSTRHDATILLGDPASRGFTVLLFRRGELVAVECVNRAGDFMAARKLLSRKPKLLYEDALATGFDLRGFEAATRS